MIILKIYLGSQEEILDYLVEVYFDYKTREMVMAEVEYNGEDKGSNFKSILVKLLLASKWGDRNENKQ